jgi:fatty-acyl-CoA synthase
VQINDELPRTATSKILKRDLIREGVTAAGGVLWERQGRGTTYVVTNPG